METVGSDSFTTTGDIAPPDCVLGLLFVLGTEGAPVDLKSIAAPGVGLPSLCPPRANGTYFFFGATYLPWFRQSSTSTA